METNTDIALPESGTDIPVTITIEERDVWESFESIPASSVDLIILDGPYNITSHLWDRISDIQSFNLALIKASARILRPGGSMYLFGKHNSLDFIDYRPWLTLNARIIWYTPGRLAQGRRNYTNNYDVIAWFSSGKPASFNLDEIRIPQLTELTQRLRVERVPSVVNGKFGRTKFHPSGKNPGDVWGDIKQLTYRSKELVSRDMLNTIQKPEQLIRRLILANTSPGQLVFDPFCGTGTTPAVAQKLGRSCIATDMDPRMVAISKQRLRTVVMDTAGTA